MHTHVMHRTLHWTLLDWSWQQHHRWLASAIRILCTHPPLHLENGRAGPSLQSMYLVCFINFEPFWFLMFLVQVPHSWLIMAMILLQLFACSPFISPHYLAKIHMRRSLLASQRTKPKSLGRKALGSIQIFTWQDSGMATADSWDGLWPWKDALCVRKGSLGWTWNIFKQTSKQTSKQASKQTSSNKHVQHVSNIFNHFHAQTFHFQNGSRARRRRPRSFPKASGSLGSSRPPAAPKRRPAPWPGRCFWDEKSEAAIGCKFHKIGPRFGPKILCTCFCIFWWSFNMITWFRMIS